MAPADAAEPPSRRGLFLKSPHHLVLALLTLGGGMASASVLGVLVGVGLYALGWIHLPDSRSYHEWVMRQITGKRDAAEAAEISTFIARRKRVLSELSPERRDIYDALAVVARDIEVSSRDASLTPDDPGADPRLRKLDELMWTYLRLLGIEQSLEQFLRTERADQLPESLADATNEASRVEKELNTLRESGNNAESEPKRRLLASLQDRATVLAKRLARFRQAEENLRLVAAERQRLIQQVKLIRADAVATRNADSLTARIDATVEHLGETNRWLAELDEFKDMVGDMPRSQQRVGFDAPPPPLPDETELSARSGRRFRERN